MSTRPNCVVCDQPIEGQVYTLGGRTYDAEHYQRLARVNRAAIGPLLFTIGAVVIFAAVVAVLAGATNLTLTGTPLVVAGVILALVPALLWLGGVYQQDRLEPGAKRDVIGGFFLGALVGAGGGGAG